MYTQFFVYIPTQVNEIIEQNDNWRVWGGLAAVVGEAWWPRMSEKKKESVVRVIIDHSKTGCPCNG